MAAAAGPAAPRPAGSDASAWTNASASAAQADARRPDSPLTLSGALAMDLLGNPELEAASLETRAAESRALQAGLRPNPELEIEVEGFGGTRGRKGYDAAETTARITQTLELGGKRAKRRRAARSEARLSAWDCEAKRLDALTLTVKAFVDVLHAQGQLALAESLLGVAEDVRRAAAERVKSGKVPLLEETKAGVEAVHARIARERARRELDTARQRLAASWGEATPAFGEAIGNLDSMADVPALETLAARLDAVPEVARWNEEVTLAKESLTLANAQGIPDLDVCVGVNRSEEDGSQAATAGFSLPLPLFDRNAGGILAAKHRLARAECEQRAARLRARMDLVEAHTQLETARTEAAAIKTELLPGAEQAFDAAQKGYGEGKFSHLDVLDAQRTLSETKARYLETLAAYHKALSDVERLSGTQLKVIQ
jgi:cobalt-zinc-cadmium efflux system outer membrane protein